MAHPIGIDLGTTNCAISIFEPDQGDAEPRILMNRDQERTLPSAIAFESDGMIFGEQAKELQAIGLPVATYFKRCIGDTNYRFEAGSSQYTATELSGFLLGALREDASKALGQDVTAAVITVPAYFRDTERRATTEAGKLAGLNVLRTINEPTAAAIAYGSRLDGARKKLLVYDLGGGTFDVTILNIDKHDMRILASAGDNRLGGKDWDDWIMLYVAGQFEKEFGFDPLNNLETCIDLQIRAEGIKKSLSSREKATISLICDGERGRYHVTRDAFETGTAALLARTESLTQSVLDEMSLQPNDIDGVILVGGSTRMPIVSRSLTKLFGRPPLTGVNPDLAVAQGAAIIAERSQHTQLARGKPRTSYTQNAGSTGLNIRNVIDVTNHSLGMISLTPDGDAYINAKILRKNQPIPCDDTRPFTLATQPRVGGKLEIFLTQGETNNPADPVYIGLYVADNIPHSDTGKALIDVRYTYDESGEVKVTGKVRNGPSLDIQRLPLPLDVPDRFLRPPSQTQNPDYLSLILVFDLSGSMAGSPLKAAKKAGQDFLSQLDMAHSSAAVLGVANKNKFFQELCQDASKVSRALDKLCVSKTETGIGNLGHPFKHILEHFHGVTGRRFAIVLADGAWAHQDRAITAAQKCHAEGIEIVAIGFGAADQTFLKAIASSDEGSIFTTQAGLSDVFGTIAQALAETGSVSGLRVKER